MSFIEARSDISICNRALSKVMQAELTGALDDAANRNKLSARECVRWYKPTVRRLLEQHHFGIATKRTALVAGPSNMGEWAYAYSPPTDLAFPVSLQPWGANYGTANVSWYRGVGYLLGMMYGRPTFRYQGGVIYSNIADATLDYVSFNITEQEFSATFENLVVLFLASELAMPLAKDRQLSRDLKQEATAELNQAIAQSLNEKQQRYDEGPSQAELARNGFDLGVLDLGRFG